MLAIFIAKSLFRFIHIMCGCVLIGNAVTDLYWEKEFTPGYDALIITCGILLFVSGIVNIILAKPSVIFNHEDRRVWTAIVYTKLVLWFFFLRIPDSLCSLWGYSFPREKLNFFLVVIVGIVSVLAKIFRDTYSRKPDEILKEFG